MTMTNAIDVRTNKMYTLCHNHLSFKLEASLKQSFNFAFNHVNLSSSSFEKPLLAVCKRSRHSWRLSQTVSAIYLLHVISQNIILRPYSAINNPSLSGCFVVISGYNLQPMSSDAFLSSSVPFKPLGSNLRCHSLESMKP